MHRHQQFDAGILSQQHGLPAVHISDDIITQAVMIPPVDRQEANVYLVETAGRSVIDTAVSCMEYGDISQFKLIS